MNSIISFILVFIFLASIGTTIYLLTKYTKNEVVYLDTIENPDKEMLLKLMNIGNIREKIDIEKIETPKVYNNIFYKIYFGVHSTEDVINDSMNQVQNNLHIGFERIGTINRRTEYCCTISDYDNRIYDLDRLRNKYKQVERI